MDKSSDYIRMCDKADEIQGQWSPAHGDFFVGQDGRIECWVDLIHAQRNMTGNWEVRETGEGVIKVWKYIWLPRLDQLMELAQVPSLRFEKVTQLFFDWTRTHYPGCEGDARGVFSSLEQTWLAFIMQRKFRKNWNGSDFEPM